MPNPVRLLLDHFPDLTRLPGSVPELRKLILQRAVRGELTADWRQAHPDTEPASVLLEKIKAEKARLVKEGKIKKENPLPEIGEDEVPFALPEGWVWCRLGVMIELLSGQHIQTTDYNENHQGIPYLTGPVDFGDKYPVITKWTESPKTIAQKNDILITVKGAGVGKLNIVNIDYVCISRQLMALRVIGCNNDAIYSFLRSQQEAINQQSIGIAIPGIGRDTILEYLYPLPPLAEQQEIVARVERLLGLCDQLETAHEAEEAVRVRTRRASLAALDGEGDSPALWRMVQDRFAVLIRTPEDVRELRKTILQLAVRGRLTADWRRAHPDTESASVLLEKIKAEKARLVKEGKIKKENPLPEIGEDEVPFALPEGWVWCRLGEVAEVITSGSRDWAKYYTNEKKAIFIRMGNLSRGSYLLRLNKIQYVDPPRDSEGKRTRLESGDILISITGEVGNLGLIPEGFGEAYINQHTALVRLAKESTRLFFCNMFLSTMCQVQFNEPDRGIKNSYRLTDIEELVIALPPLGEQQEVVARVERLLGMCDCLEANLTDAGEMGARVWRAMEAG